MMSDITRHKFNSVRIDDEYTLVDSKYKIIFLCDHDNEVLVTLNKDDAIAIAKHFKLIDDV